MPAELYDCTCVVPGKYCIALYGAWVVQWLLTKCGIAITSSEVHNIWHSCNLTYHPSPCTCVNERESRQFLYCTCKEFGIRDVGCSQRLVMFDHMDRPVCDRNRRLRSVSCSCWTFYSGFWIWLLCKCWRPSLVARLLTIACTPSVELFVQSVL